jgi:tryptophan 2,3-dioxygenase
VTPPDLAPHDGAAAPGIDYGSYLALDALLGLQRPRSAGPAGDDEHPDELLFIVVHQASELWFKVLLRELDALREALAERDGAAPTPALRVAQAADRALWRIGRINGLMRIVAGQLTALDTLPPQRFQQFRGYLGSSSGSQSVQFRAIEAASGLREPHFLAVLREHGEVPPMVAEQLARPTLQELFLAMLADAGVTPEDLYVGPGPTTLFLVAEGMLEYEQQFARWRFAHVQLVERIIGPGTGGTGGTLGAKYLSRTVAQRFFPVLWEVRSRLYGAASARS